MCALLNNNRLTTLFFYAVILFKSTMSDGRSFCTQIDRCMEPFKDRARYDNYRIYSVEFSNKEQVEIFKKLEKQSDSMSFIGHPREVGQKLSILIAAHKVSDITALLKQYEVKYRILTYNFQEKIDRSYSSVAPIETAPAEFDWHRFYHLETIYKWMDSLAKLYPQLITVLDMGTSTQGIAIKGIKLSHKSTNKTIFIEAGIHAREWIAPATANFIINYLLTSDEQGVQELAKSYNWIIFPCINPDGYRFTFEYDRMWRKNRQLFSTCYGVDLNRNYPAHWNSTGSSSNPCHYDYAGPSVGSELETQRLMKFIEDNASKEQIRTYIALHSYSQMIMFPYGYTKDHAPNYDDLKELGQKACATIKNISGKTYITGSLIETIYPSSGGSVDWAYNVHGIPIAYTFELRGPPESEDMFILPAEEILPTAQEAFAAIRSIVEGAADKGYYK